MNQTSLSNVVTFKSDKENNQASQDDLAQMHSKDIRQAEVELDAIAVTVNTSENDLGNERVNYLTI